MRLVLDPAQETAHEEWLHRTHGAYEWWYFDAISDTGDYALTCIWFLGNPFSPYYRASTLGRPADPYRSNALFFALYHHGRLYAYHFTCFPQNEIYAENDLCFGPNRLTFEGNSRWCLTLQDSNGNGRVLSAELTFTAPPLVAAEAAVLFSEDEPHSWLPIAPYCRVSGEILLGEAQNSSTEKIAFRGTGYHDHNWGRLPFDAGIRDWYWARAALSGERAVILYHVRPRDGKGAVSHFLLFDGGRLTHYDAAPKVQLSRTKVNSFGTAYATRLLCVSGALTAQFDLGARLDSAPFYIRAFCAASVTNKGQTEQGQGIGEYLRPATMSWWVSASAMKARIVER